MNIESRAGSYHPPTPSYNLPSLPSEIIINIFVQCVNTPFAIVTAQLTCQQLFHIGNDAQIWKACARNMEINHDNIHRNKILRIAQSYIRFFNNGNCPKDGDIFPFKRCSSEQIIELFHKIAFEWTPFLSQETWNPQTGQTQKALYLSKERLQNRFAFITAQNLSQEKKTLLQQAIVQKEEAKEDVSYLPLPCNFMNEESTLQYLLQNGQNTEKFLTRAILFSSTVETVKTLANRENITISSDLVTLAIDASAPHQIVYTLVHSGAKDLQKRIDAVLNRLGEDFSFLFQPEQIHKGTLQSALEAMRPLKQIQSLFVIGKLQVTLEILITAIKENVSPEIMEFLLRKKGTLSENEKEECSNATLSNLIISNELLWILKYIGKIDIPRNMLSSRPATLQSLLANQELPLSPNEQLAAILTNSLQLPLPVIKNLIRQSSITFPHAQLAAEKGMDLPIFLALLQKSAPTEEEMEAFLKNSSTLLEYKEKLLESQGIYGDEQKAKIAQFHQPLQPLPLVNPFAPHINQDQEINDLQSVSSSDIDDSEEEYYPTTYEKVIKWMRRNYLATRILGTIAGCFLGIFMGISYILLTITKKPNE